MLKFSTRALRNQRLEAFLGNKAQPLMPYGSLSPQLNRRICLPVSTPRWIAPPQPIGGWPTPLRPLITHFERFRNVDRMSITYASRPRLRTRLTSRRPSGLRKTRRESNSLAHRTTWLRSDFLDGSHLHNQSEAGLPRCVPSSLILSGSGMLTGCPSPTPLGLG